MTAPSMSYDDAVATFFTAPPEGTEPPPASLRASGARRLRDAIEPIATQGIWAAEVNTACAELGSTSWAPTCGAGPPPWARRRRRW